MQFQIPQFIETEDKIVGPFTLKQFGYLAAAGALDFILYFLVNTGVWFLLAFFVTAAGAALAFVKINGQPLPSIVTAAFGFFWKPQRYVWQAERKDFKSAPGRESGGHFPLEKIVAGFALKRAWRTVQTGSKEPPATPVVKSGNERYQIFRGAGGEKRAARRVDYR